MEFSAIFHDMNKKYCYAVEKGKFLFRIKAKKNDLKKVVLHYSDKYIDVNWLDTRACIQMYKTASDRYHDYYEVMIDIDVICLRYFFELTDHMGQVSYYGNYEFFEEKIERIDDMFDCPQNLREEEQFLIPEWAKNKVIYQIFPSRFANSEDVPEEIWYKAPIGHQENLSGNLRGLIEHLDHMKDLGVDVIYMTPIFYSDSTHKYDTIDYYKVDPGFGTEEDLAELVRQAHDMGMKVILDGVFNHTSPKFFAFADISQNEEQSKYKDWYYIENFPMKTGWQVKPNFKSFAYYGGMPKVNLQNPEVADYFINVAVYWIKKCDIDGWRLDVADEISHYFWRKFRQAVKQVKEDVLLVGEEWHFAGDFLDGDEWDSVMNYVFYFSVQNFVAKETITASRFIENLDFLRGNLHHKVYPVLWNLIDSHDTPRFLHVCGEQKEKLRLAVALQMLLSGMPLIYYGDEYGMTGANDPDCRRGMLWHEKYQDKELYAWYQALIRLRKEHSCITEGKEVDRKTDDEQGLIFLTKENSEEKITVIFHGKNNAVLCMEYAGMRDLLTGKNFDGIVEGYGVKVLL